MVADKRGSSPSPKASAAKTPTSTSASKLKAEPSKPLTLFGYKMPTKQLLLDALITSLCVFGGVYVLSLLDSHPMPFLTKGGLYDFGLKDIKFYCPPHGAIACILMSAKDLPSLYNMAIAIFLGAASAVAMVELGGRYGLAGDQAMLRAGACGIAIYFMKIAGSVFAPAAALAALFVDNKAMQSGIGRAFVLMPGISGTVVLFILAYIKVTLTAMYNKPASPKKEL